jgi:hypothetical protein
MLWLHLMVAFFSALAEDGEGMMRMLPELTGDEADMIAVEC